MQAAEMSTCQAASQTTALDPQTRNTIEASDDLTSAMRLALGAQRLLAGAQCLLDQAGSPRRRQRAAKRLTVNRVATASSMSS